MCVRHSVLRHQLSSINNHPVLSKGFVVGASLHHFDGPQEPEDLEHPEDLDDAQHPVVVVAPRRLTVLEASLLPSELRSVPALLAAAGNYAGWHCDVHRGRKSARANTPNRRGSRGTTRARWSRSRTCIRKIHGLGCGRWMHRSRAATIRSLRWRNAGF